MMRLMLVVLALSLACVTGQVDVRPPEQFGASIRPQQQREAQLAEEQSPRDEEDLPDETLDDGSLDEADLELSATPDLPPDPNLTEAQQRRIEKLRARRMARRRALGLDRDPVEDYQEEDFPDEYREE